MPNPVVALAGGSIGATAIGANSAKKAADAQTAAADSANATQRYIFDENTKLTEPWREAGQNALAPLMSMAGIGRDLYFTDRGLPMRSTNVDGVLGWEMEIAPNRWQAGKRTFETEEDQRAYMDRYKFGVENTPGYEFRHEEGMKAIERMAAARGLRLSGGALKEAGRFADGMASQEFDQQYNRLAGIAGIGQTATSQQAAMGQSYANNVSQNTLAAGQARASGYQGVNNALQSGIESGYGILSMAKMGQLGPNPGFGITPSPVGLKLFGYS